MASLISKASLLMVPSVYEDGTLYNVLPSGNKAPDETGNHNGYDQTRADFTFSRGSNLAATRVNASGLIEKGRENVVLHSNSFDNAAWGKTNITLTSGQADKDGGTEAWKISETTANSVHILLQTTSSIGMYTFSVYLKSGTKNKVMLFDGTNNLGAKFNLETKSFNSFYGASMIYNIEELDNGWARYSITAPNTSTAFRVYLLDDSYGLVYTGDETNNIYIQDAQVELGLVSTPVIRTGATTATAGILENTPRIDYSSGAGSLKLEPQRTNLLPHSEYVEGNPLSNSPTITQNYAISPDGGKNAFRMQDVDANDYERFRYLGTESTLCMSLFVKKTTSAVSTYGGFGLNWSGGTSKNVYAAFDEYNGTMAIIGNDTGNAQVFVEDHDTYWRFALSATDTGSNTAVSANFYACISTNFTSPGLGLKDYTAYGAQLESASYPSSYVPTYGSAATRGADSITSGTITAPLSGGYTAFIEVETLSTSDYNQIQFRETAANYVLRIGNQVNVGSGALIQANTTGMNKFALQVSSGGAFELFKNGSSVGTGTGITHDIELIKTDLAGQNVKKIIIFNEALTDAECQTLTA